MQTSMPSRRIVPAICLIAYIIVWVIMAINPVYPDDWLLENILAVLGVGFLVISYRWFPSP